MKSQSPYRVNMFVTISRRAFKDDNHLVSIPLSGQYVCNELKKELRVAGRATVSIPLSGQYVCNRIENISSVNDLSLNPLIGSICL